MKTRIIVSVIAIPLLILLVFLAPLWAFAILIALISAGAAWEFVRCTDPDSATRLRVYPAVSAFLIVYFSADVMNTGFLSNTAAYILGIIVFMEVMLSYRKEEHISVNTAMHIIFAGIVMPMLLGSLVRIGRWIDEPRLMSPYLFLTFVATFSSDSFAYLVGTSLGKKKIFPSLSPNKTLAGCIGGVAGSLVMMLLYGFVLSRFDYTVSYWLLAVYGLLGGAACEFGDLVFSAVKRDYGIKDYGNLIPGHGGILDRFDSIHFTAPIIELLVMIVPAIK